MFWKKKTKQVIKGREHTSYFKITSILQKYIVSLLTEKEILENYIQEIWDSLSSKEYLD